MRILSFMVNFLVITASVNCFGQTHPLSKHDSAVVVKYLEQYRSNLELHENHRDASHYLNEIAFIYWEHNQYKEAIKYYKMSLKLNEEIENENGIAMINNNLGMLHADILEFEHSYNFFTATLAARRSKNERIGMISAMINLSVVLNNLERYDESITHLQEALKLSREMNDVDQMKSCYGMLSETYEKAGNTKQTIYYFDLYKTFTQMAQDEKINNIIEDFNEEKISKQKIEKENEENLRKLEVKQNELESIRSRSQAYDIKLNAYDSLNKALYADLNQKELQLEVLTKESQIQELQTEKDMQAQKIEKEEQKRIRQVILASGIGLIILIFFLTRNYILARQVNTHLKEKNKKIEQQRIQLEDLNNNLQTKVKERTETLQVANEKLSEYIFSNSHIIRRPVANIKGLIELMQKDKDLEEKSDLFNPLRQSIEELDQAIYESNDNLTLNEAALKQYHHPTSD